MGKPVQADHDPVHVWPMIHGAPEGQDARILSAYARDLMREDACLLHICADEARLFDLESLIRFFAPDVRVVVFPGWDCLPYDRVSPHPDVLARRIAALVELRMWADDPVREPRIVLASVASLLQRVMPRSRLDAAQLDLKTGGILAIESFQDFAACHGYVRTDTVRESGEYAIRGGIVDLFPPGREAPVRIDLFGETIESIRSFDPETQRSGERIHALRFFPAREFSLDPESVNRFRAGYRAAFGVPRADDPVYEAVSSGRILSGMDHWGPLFFEKSETLFDYLGKYTVFLDSQVEDARAERLDQIRDYYEARRTFLDAAAKKTKKSGDVSLSGAPYHPLPPESLYLSQAEWAGSLSGHDPRVLSAFSADDPDGSVHGPGLMARKGRDFSDIRKMPDGDLFGEVRRHLASLYAPGRKVLIALYSGGSLDRVRGLLGHAGVSGLKTCTDWESVRRLSPGEIGLVVLALNHGFVASDLAVVTEQDILGDRLARAGQTRRRRADHFLREVSTLSPGDLVVHVDHGIGRFLGLETLRAAGTVHDCLRLEYAGGDRLFVPVENIDVLSRFGSDEGQTPLDKLGGAGWQTRRARVKKDLMRIAAGLLEVAAARLVKRVDPVHASGDPWQDFVARFPYQETEDQERAIADVLRDLEKGHPMDRLVCGDVGFGKTEVAMRAAWVMAHAGRQVAVVVPTTLLSRQHYQSFIARFSGTGLRIEQISRLVPAREAARVRSGLADGSVRIVVGTHAVFGKDTRFKDLGLLVVDEEQHFGVKQKERLKEIKENVHVLTLSATPIPRTLQMALSGVRELSLIATPPVDRLAVRTFVLPYDPVVIREALLREHYRGGQSFYVCPRIKDLPDLEGQIRDLVPEIRVISAHGQMAPTDLEDRMTAFYDGQYDLLLATNIIESGIDIPRANTMIVHRADMFGLSQLYQLRGRIGRARMRAYAYLTWPAGKALTKNARKRLEIIETLDTLGAGFQLASHDLDIRGAGNMLGEEQTGHIREVGVELYQQMLEEAVAAVRQGNTARAPETESWSPIVNLGVSVLIPEHYVTDLDLRMGLYRRLGDLETPEEIEAFAAEMIDRFGSLPPDVETLLAIVGMRQLCRKAGIARVDAGSKGAVIGFYQDRPAAPPDRLIRWISDQRGAVRLRPDQKLAVVREWPDSSARIKGVRAVLDQIAGLS